MYERPILVTILSATLAACGCDREQPDDDDTTAADDDTTDPGDDDDTGSTDDDSADDDDAAVSLFAGSPGGAGFADGVGTDALFYHPYGIAHHDGLLYISDGWSNTIRVFDPVSGEVTTLAGVAGVAGYRDSADGDALFSYPCGLEMGPDGMLYVADRNNGVIRVVDPVTGEVWSLQDTEGTVATQEVFDVTFDDSHNLYFSDLGGCTIRSVNLDTGVSAVVAGVIDECHPQDGDALTARIGLPRGLAWHEHNDIYYCDRAGDNVRRVDLDTGDVVTLAGDPEGNEYGLVDGYGPLARFKEPTGIAIGESVAWITDSDNDSIRRVHLGTGLVTTVAGIGENGNVDGPGVTAAFSWPIGVTIGPDGQLYMVDPGGHCVRRVDIDDPDYTVTTVAGTVGNAGSVDGVGTVARMSEPQGLAAGEGGTAWLLDSLNSEVRTFDLDTAEVVTVAGSAVEFGHLDGIGEEARFTNPTGAVLVDGVLYVVEVISSVIRTVDPVTREVVTVAGDPDERGNVDGVGLAARFDKSRDIELGSDGMLYVLDTGNMAVRRFDPDTLEVSTLLATDAADNPLDKPEGMAADGDGNLWITDREACVLVRLPIDGFGPEVIAGVEGECELVDGDSGEARLFDPTGLDVDPQTGLVYIASLDGHVIRTFDPASGELHTLAGDPDVMSMVDGDLAEATFSTPVDVLVVEDELFVLDRYSAHIRRVELPR